jgi:hypothetical protein
MITAVSLRLLYLIFLRVLGLILMMCRRASSTVVPGVGDGADDPAGVALIDELVREGARRMLAEALQVEVDAYTTQFEQLRVGANMCR